MSAAVHGRRKRNMLSELLWQAFKSSILANPFFPDSVTVSYFFVATAFYSGGGHRN
jgi:hypothetical protein